MFRDFFKRFSNIVKEKTEYLMNSLVNNFNFIELEKSLISLLRKQLAILQTEILQQFFSNESIMKKIKEIGGKKSMKFKKIIKIKIRLAEGQTIEINSPYFIRTDPKGGGKKKGPNGRGCHLGLQLLGFLDKYSLNFVDNISQMSILCPSAEIAKECLSLRGISIDAKTLIKFSKKLGFSGIKKRGKVSFTDQDKDDYKGKTLVIGIDGGRLRERKTKRGKRKQDQKRQGYHTDWKEPKLFAMYLLNDDGKVVKDFKPLYDATMGNHLEFFDLLEKYLVEIPLQELNRIVFCGDGAPWIWNDITNLCKKLDIPKTQIHQVIDYTHAKQNLNDLLELLPVKLKKKDKIAEECKNLLFSGKIEKIKQVLSLIVKGSKKKFLLKKWENYFLKNKDRMQYETFKANGIPTGSGFVESAIRRVINLRLKSAGTFWKKETAESFLFLRSQLLSGRWNIFIYNVCKELRRIA